MPAYRAPLRDVRFLMNDVFDYPAHYQALSAGASADQETVDMILEGMADFCENVLSPLYQPASEEGCHFDPADGSVRTPKGFKEAYDQYVQGGWQGLSYPVEYGGQGLPMSLNLIKSEMMATANWSFVMYPGLAVGSMNTILQFGDDVQKDRYMPPLVSGEWAGTMCLTEPQCGTDLGQCKTRVEPQPDGTFRMYGTKIFISSGEHDLTDNIIHIVLARLPDAPQGTRGLTLFIVPKVLINEDGSLGERNQVRCGSIEHKMGISASATCVLNFDGATAYQIGPDNKGLECMFTFMNTARIGTAVQGVAHAELSYQGAVPYARERMSMRSLSGKKNPDKVADTIINHGDVRRMLLTQRAFAEGGRAMIFHAAMLADKMTEGLLKGDQAEHDYWDDRLGFFTPILKGFLTEVGLEAANHGMQVYGGHGYIREWGMEQIARDARIATLYEGTTGVQALDLLGRKVLLQSKGKVVRDFTAEMAKFVAQHARNPKMRRFVWDLTKLGVQWNTLTVRLMLAARKDREIVSAASVDFLMYSGYIMMGYFWAQMAAVAFDKLEQGGSDTREFYEAKVQTAEFYFERILTRTAGHAESMTSPSSAVMQMTEDNFMTAYTG